MKIAKENVSMEITNKQEMNRFPWQKMVDADEIQGKARYQQGK